MSNNVLAVNNLQVKFITEDEPVTAIDKISFELKQGQILGIVGESGSGKSITSLAIMNLIPPPGKIAGGDIWFYPEEAKDPVNLLTLRKEEKRHYRGGEIGMIFQEPMSSLNPVYNVGFQITEAIRLHQNVSPPEARRQAIARLQEVKLIPTDEELKQEYITQLTLQKGPSVPSDRQINEFINQQKQSMLKRYPHELSGGQLQRIMIAMAISCNPTILIADEPTTALDVTVQASILSLLKNLCRDRGMALIFISHDLGVIGEIADAVAVMYRGQIVEYGDIQHILFKATHPYTKGLLACRPRLDSNPKYLPTVADFMEVETNSQGELNIKEKQPEIEPENQELQAKKNRLAKLSSQHPLMSVENLRVGFPRRTMFGGTKSYFMAVKNVSFDVYPGETLGLVGESGCGKSTLARAILRLLPVLEGHILYKGQNIAYTKTGDKKMRPLRQIMQIIFQNPYNSLNPRMTIGKAIMEPMIIHKQGGNNTKRKDRVAYLLERVGLDPNLMNRYPHEFSGGQRQRVCIARALALNPQFIICDESVSALDVSVQAQVLNLLKELQEEFGLTYIFISHDLSVVKFISDRIMVMNQGIIEEIGPAEQVYRHPQSTYTRELIASIPTGGLENQPRVS